MSFRNRLFRKHRSECSLLLGSDEDHFLAQCIEFPGFLTLNFLGDIPHAEVSVTRDRYLSVRDISQEIQSQETRKLDALRQKMIFVGAEEQ